MQNNFTLYYWGIILNPHGNISIQKDGITMGSIFGPIFSNFYMSNLENNVYNTINKPNIYLRNVDDILLLTNEMNIIQETFQRKSVLYFTQELSINNEIPFLVVFIDISNMVAYWPLIELSIKDFYTGYTCVNQMITGKQAMCGCK